MAIHLPLPFPRYQEAEKGPGKPTPRPSKVGPGRKRQNERLGGEFSRLTKALDSDRLAAQSDGPQSLDPEAVLILEVAGAIDDFDRAVRRVPGLEFLAEAIEDAKVPDTEDFALVDGEGRRSPADVELFVVATDIRASRELERLWDEWVKTGSVPPNFGRWRQLFERLRSVRRWSDRDRLARTGAVEAWSENLAVKGQQPVRFEAELWYRGDSSRRTGEQAALARDLEAIGGRVIRGVEIQEIEYHGVLAEAPAAALSSAAETLSVPWLSHDGVRFLRPAGQFPVPFDGALTDDESTPISSVSPSGQPRVAVLDGVPLADHDDIQGRVVVDDPLGWQATEESQHRRHGTAMLSLVVRGDLNSSDGALRAPVYCRPILRVDPAMTWVRNPAETIPADRLPAEFLQEAVERMVVGDDAVAPAVRVVNLSVGDPSQVFDRFVSPFARMVDFLAAEYGLLFVVSAGNIEEPLLLDVDPSKATRAQLRRAALGAVADRALLHKIIAPAEAVNALTVGGWHADASEGEVPDGLVDPFAGDPAPSPVGRVGAGFRRAVKPDVVAPAGRQVYRPVAGSNTLHPVGTPSGPGIAAAAPGRAGVLDAVAHSVGTSGACAVTTHAAGRALEFLDEMRATYEGFPDDDFDAVMTKSLLGHGASWDLGAKPVKTALRKAHLSPGKFQVGAFLGHGEVRAAWPLSDEEHRATLIAAARIGSDKDHVWTFPVPECLSDTAVVRRITVTCAWFSPINPRHRYYRRAAVGLTYGAEASELAPLKAGADYRASRRGTLIHDVFDGKEAIALAEDSSLAVRVSARADAGIWTGPMPYAIAVTLETPIEAKLPVRQQVHARVPVRLKTRVKA